MGYSGKVHERQLARELRARSWTLVDIAQELGVSKSSVSVWVRDIEFVPTPTNRGHASQSPHPLHIAKLAAIERTRREGFERVGRLSDREFLILGLALYAGEGSKTSGSVRFTNTDPRLILVFVTWLRRYFQIDERKLRVKLYLHDHPDLRGAIGHWSAVTGIPPTQFGKAYRAVADPSIRTSKHPMGCVSVVYHSTNALRRVMGMIEAVTSATAFPG